MVFARVAVPVPLSPLDTLLDYAIPEEWASRVTPGSFVEVPFGRRKTWALVFEVASETLVAPEKIKSLLAAKFDRPIFDSTRLEFLRWLSKYYFFPLGEVCETAIPGPVRDGTERTLKPKIKPATVTASVNDVAKILNSAQSEAVDRILKMKSGAHLLWGVTGSGKTEVYLQVIEETLRRGRGALVLVPEISLTPQLTKRFSERFPNDVAVFHSAQKPSDLRKAWLAAFNGEKRIAVGARSALFAPIQNLGVIIVDEEHDSSYKQEERLRYHARDCALKLGELYKIPVVLGSATPSSETIYQSSCGTQSESRLPERAVGQSILPQIRIVDLKKGIAQKNLDPEIFEANTSDEWMQMSNVPSIRGEFFLSSELRAELDQTLADEKQAILFLNRRGVGSQVLCRSCGHVFDCPLCDVKLTPHRDRMMCHYCGLEAKLPAKCPQCHQSENPFVQVGVGTAAIEEAVKFHYPSARVLRLDRDTTETRGNLESIVDDFANLRADILIGTQMVAKGHDFPNVTLVGILLGEMGLAVPDFRAFERSLQLLLQVSGRAGRGLHPGRVILQTFQPEHPVFVALEAFKELADYEHFIKTEISKRQMLHYPPTGKLVLMKFDGLAKTDVEAAAQKVAGALRTIDSDKISVLGPVESPIAKIRGRYRWQILVKATTLSHLQKSVAWIVEGWEKQKMEKEFRSRLLVDVDPLQML